MSRHREGLLFRRDTANELERPGDIFLVELGHAPIQSI
jgi:hypothetical protein